MSKSDSTDFFIVDNSDEHWKALEYVKQWCQLSEKMDIATGYFEVGALLALDGEWQKVDKIRLLVGSETGQQTVEVIRDAKRILDESFNGEREVDPFLKGLPAVVEGIVSGKIEIRVYTRKKFHAKTYITHARLDVVGSAALVGSSNFTKPGLTKNIELNVRFNGVEVRDLQAWFENYWDDAEDIRPEILAVLERHNREYTPLEIYGKALQALTANIQPSAAEWERSESKIYPMLAPYQREAYHGLKQRAAQWGGAFLTDGVGLGKTFVGLMLAEYYAKKERKNVLIMATKTGQDAVWEPELQRLLPELTGVFSNVMTMAHTDLTTKNAWEKAKQLRDRVDVVIIDEAHNFRNHGKRGDDEENPKSRWWRLQEICKDKLVFNLTATPINNTLFDFVHEFELFTGLQDSYFSPLGIPSVRSYVANLERVFHAANSDSTDFEMSDFEKLLKDNPLLRALIVQNSRKYAQESAKKVGGPEVRFPKPELPRAVPYSYGLLFASLLSDLEKAFEKKNPLFILPMYYALAYSKKKDVDIVQENRQKQVVGLIRTVFLKRFESSIAAFAGSCVDLATKIAAWIDNSAGQESVHRKQVAQWRELNSDLIHKAHQVFRQGVDVNEWYDEDEEDLVLPGFENLVRSDELNPDEYDLEKMFADAYDDLLQITSLLQKTLAVGQDSDDKYEQLRALLIGGNFSRKSNDKEVFRKEFTENKVIVFTEFADTARYLYSRLAEDGLVELDRLDGSRKSNRVEMIKRFAPYYNRVTGQERAQQAPLRVLVSTDVLAEGVNLQDASLVVNYDIHWNPVRLMQRIGRVDRRLDPDREAEIVKENPKTKGLRGKIIVRNFLPPDDLNRVLSLYNRVQGRVLLISKTLGIPGGRLLTEEDMLDDTKVFGAFLEEYEGDISPVEVLRLKYLDLLNENPSLEAVLDQMPRGAYSSKAGPEKGVFICSVEPIRVHHEDSDEVNWTLDNGTVQWRMHSGGQVDTSLLHVDGLIASSVSDKPRYISDQAAVAKFLADAVDARLKQMMKEQQLPLDAPKPMVLCWMEVQ